MMTNNNNKYEMIKFKIMFITIKSIVNNDSQVNIY